MNVYFPGERRVGQQTIRAKSFFFSNNAGETNEHDQQTEPSAFGWMSEEDSDFTCENADRVMQGGGSTLSTSIERSADYPNSRTMVSERESSRSRTARAAGRKAAASAAHQRHNRRRPRLMTEQAQMAKRHPGSVTVQRPCSAPTISLDPTHGLNSGGPDFHSASSVGSMGKQAIQIAPQQHRRSVSNVGTSKVHRPLSASMSTNTINSVDRSTSAGENACDSGYNQKEKVRQSIARLKQHRLKQTSKQKGMREELEGFARQQRRQLFECIQVANECCSQLKLSTTYAMPDDPRKRGIFDTETLRTAGMKVDVLRNYQLVGSISDTHFYRELESLQLQRAAQPHANLEAAAQVEAAENSVSKPSASSRPGIRADSVPKTKIDTAGGRWKPTEEEAELRKFIYDTVELASTLTDQVSTLKHKAGRGGSFSSYV
eukprot:SAG31_NODE_2992_length_4809_cov_1.664544_3_plen_432_part_00